MVETGDLVVPHYRGQPFFDKPALAYWLMTASFHLFGVDPGAGRLVSALAALGAVAATVALGRTRLGLSAALFGGLALATTHAFVSFGRLAMSDMLLTFFSTSAVALASLRVPPAWSLARAAGVGAVLGAGFMTKGPVAVLFPLFGIVSLGWVRRERRVAPGSLIVAAIAFLAVGLPWFVAVYRRLGTGPLVYFFLRENLERFAGATYDAGRPIWYYLPTYLALGLPWSVFLPVAAFRIWRDEAHAELRGLLLWAGLMVVPLSLSRGKVDYYLLPLLPPLSLVIGHFFARNAWTARVAAYVRGAALLLAVLLVVLVVAPWWLPAGWRPPVAVAAPLSAVLAALSVALVVATRRTVGTLVGAVAAASAGAHLAGLIWLLPAFTGGQPNARVLEDVTRERRYRPDAGFAFCSDPTRVSRDILFYERLAGLDSCDKLWAAAGGSVPFLILVSETERQSLAQIPFVREVGEYAYVAPTALSAASVLSAPKPSRLFLIANYETDEPVAMERWRRERRRDLRELDAGPN
jgi:4-amino-4-deoxy-L-arabinose transferase-like glycosyltransferase